MAEKSEEKENEEVFTEYKDPYPIQCCAKPKLIKNPKCSFSLLAYNHRITTIMSVTFVFPVLVLASSVVPLLSCIFFGGARWLDIHCSFGAFRLSNSSGSTQK